MNYTSYFKLLEPFQEQLTGVYSTATLIISILLLLWFVNFIVGLIGRIYSFGRNTGSFYRNFIHRYFRILLYSLLRLLSIGKYKKVYK